MLDLMLPSWPGGPEEPARSSGVEGPGPGSAAAPGLVPAEAGQNGLLSSAVSSGSGGGLPGPAGRPGFGPGISGGGGGVGAGGNGAVVSVSERIGRLLEQCPLASESELAALAGLSRSSVSYGLLELEDLGLAARSSLGWQRRLVSRWWLTEAGVERFHWQGWGSWNEEWALGRLLERLVVAENVYTAAAALAGGGGAAAAGGLGAFTRMKWLQRKAGDAAADYERGWAVFLWCGKAEGPRRLEARLQRFADELPDLAEGGGDLWPSAFVALAADCWQGQVAREVFAEFRWQDQLFVWCCQHQAFERRGQVRPGRGRVYQALQRPGPENWPWAERRAAACWSQRDGAGAGWLLSLVFEWPGLAAGLASGYLGRGNRERTVRAWGELLATAGLVEVFRDLRPRRMALSKKGLGLMVTLDRVGRADAYRKSLGQSWLSTGRLKKHEEGLMELVGGLAAAGCPAAAGWRYWEHLGGSGGIVPDALVWLEQSPYGRGWHFVEYERSARSEGRVRRKLWGYGRPHRKNSWPVMVVCWDDAAEAVFRQVGEEEGIPMLTTTLGRLKAAGPTGAECWSCYGEPAAVGGKVAAAAAA